MRRTTRLALAATAVALAAPPVGRAATEPENPQPVVIDGGAVEVPTVAPAPDHMKDVTDRIYSDWLFRDADTQAMQMDDFANPRMVFADQSAEMWNTLEESEGKSCADCHGGIESMKGLRAVTPKMSEDGATL